MVDAALRRLRWLQAEAEVSRARAQRTAGRGRRPSEATIRALLKRAGLEWTSYRESLTYLGGNGHAPPPAEIIAGMQREAEGRAGRPEPGGAP